MKLRPYQVQAVDAVIAEWKTHDSTLVVMPTGTGKTQVFASVISQVQPQRALVLAHREELIFQAARRIEQVCGLDVQVEMAALAANATEWGRSPVVVSTIQTQCAGGGRMLKFNPNDFGVLIVDEAHHATSKSYRRVIEYYRQNPNLKVLGVTATPDRSDEMALGEVFQSVAYDYEILDGIHEGWLVPVKQQMVHVGSLDFSKVKTTAGDLNGADLASVMESEKNLHGIVTPTLAIVQNRKTLVFASSVRHAEMMCEIFNRHKPGMAGWVCGKTPKDERRKLLLDYAAGRVQVVVNVGVLTEGFDDPSVEVIAMARPTKSRCLYAQMVGRATRPLTGIVDGWDNDDQRKAAIAGSSKTACTVLDFVGNAGRHKLMTTADILGGKSSDEAIERAIKSAKESDEPVDMRDEIDRAEEDIKKEKEELRKRDESRRIKLKASVTFSTTLVDPFSAYDLHPVPENSWDKDKKLSVKQHDMLLKIGVDPDGVSYAAGRQLLNEQFRRWEHKLCSVKQALLLKIHGVATRNLKMKDASKMIDQLAKNKWKKPEIWSQQPQAIDPTEVFS